MVFGLGVFGGGAIVQGSDIQESPRDANTVYHYSGVEIQQPYCIDLGSSTERPVMIQVIGG